jgi:hypothetical protein
MRTLRWWANVLLAVGACLALLQSTGAINGMGTAVRIMMLSNEGIVDLERACAVDPEWCDRESLGRFVARHHISAEIDLGILALVVAVINLSALAKPSAQGATSGGL